MYQNGELDKVMTHFEKTLRVIPVYAPMQFDKADKETVTLENGLTSQRYIRNSYYNNGEVNRLFIMYLHGFSLGKAM